MAASLAKATIIGNLGRNPEVRTTQDGSKIVTLSVATSDFWKDRVTEERKERTEWHRIVIFNTKLADYCERALRKGQTIYVEGVIQSRKWTDAEGREHAGYEIVIRFQGCVLLVNAREHGSAGHETHGSAFSSSQGGGTEEGGSQYSTPLDDEIPF